MFSSICSFYLLFFFFFVLLFHGTFFLSFFLLVISLYPLKLFSAHEYICIWSTPLGCRCERYLGFWVEEDEYWLGDLRSQDRGISATYALDGVFLVQI
jgi:hypothetical protein